MVLVARPDTCWRVDIERLLVGNGFATTVTASLATVPYLLLSRAVAAVLADAAALRPQDLEILGRCRKVAPTTGVVLVGNRSPAAEQAGVPVPGSVRLAWPAPDSAILDSIQASRIIRHACRRHNRRACDAAVPHAIDRSRRPTVAHSRTT